MSLLIPHLQQGIDIFTKYYTDFNDPRYLEDERNYKLEMHKLAQEQLSEEIMMKLLQQGHSDELLKSIKDIFKLSKNNLPSSQEKIIITNIPDTVAEKFIQAFYNFLYGQSSWTERLTQFVDAFQNIVGKRPSWPHLTFFPFLLFPNEHMFLKPEAMTKAAEILGYQWNYKPSPDIDTYTKFQQLGKYLLADLQDLGAKDLIDAQSFLWVIVRNVWLFQANPEYYDLVEQLSQVKLGYQNTWSVDRYRGEMKPGDITILWQSGSEAGIYAIGELVDKPREYDWEPTEEEIEENPYLKAGWEVEYKYTKILTEPLSRALVKEHPILSQMQIIKMPRGTVFRVNPKEWRELEKLIKNSGYPIGIDTSSQSSQIKVTTLMIDALASYVNAHGFHFPRELLSTYYLSLQTKPFTILTGISGTGKTKLTQLFAEWISPTVEEKTIEIDVPEDGDQIFYLEVKPYYFKSGFVIPVKAYRYFNVPAVNHTASIKVQLGKNGTLTEAKFRHQQHTQGNSYIYFYSNDAIKGWLNANFNVGDFLAFEILQEGQRYRLEKLDPVEKQLVKQKPHHVFLSVRPDWTDNRGLLGFYNLITQTYQTTDFLRLLIQALLEPDAPYFAILDEMNLAKVEYYFADFLSVLESRYIQNGEIKQELLRLHDLPRCVLAQGETLWDDETGKIQEISGMCQVRCEGCPLRFGVDESYWAPTWAVSSYSEALKAGFKPERYVPPCLTLPINTYFTGTVNVDETTYMFSPKVLDRANTIEFNQVNLSDYFTNNPVSLSSIPASKAIRQHFTFNGKFVKLPKSLPELRTDPVLDIYRQHLADLNEILATYTLHFGYRVADEILLYLWHAHNLNTSDFDLNTAFDYQIYQKILPKFHGSEAKLREPLTRLREFCSTHSYQRSLTKIDRMIAQLKEGFASFA